ncbi:hypothetical protein PT974_07945 [Cladobotryum mycophilum]|uniref:Uncharacterized protein n=1 Tax=Cladobotryum mycophilum TaxID=491253 RepID=A0ABR0SD39_9HYPO
MVRLLALAAIFAAAVSAAGDAAPVCSCQPSNSGNGYPLDPPLPGRPANHHGTITGGDGDIWFGKDGVLNLQGEGETGLLLSFLHAGGHLTVDPTFRDGKLAELVVLAQLPGVLGKVTEIRLPIRLPIGH